MAMIEIEKLRKIYGSTIAVQHLDLAIEEGDVFGFIGPNGAGKTTTIRMLATLLQPTSGDARIGGNSIRGHRFEITRIKSLIGYVPDSFGVYENMSVDEYLEFFAAAYKIKGKRRRSIVDDVLMLTDLHGRKHMPVLSLSRGMQQRLGLARVLVHDPQVLLLDEPASGLDPRARIEIRELLKELQRMGKTILISSHILSELEELCNKIGIIEKGKLLYSGSIDETIERIGGGSTLLVGVEGPNSIERAVDILSADRFVEAVEHEDGHLRVRLLAEVPSAAHISTLLASRDVPITFYREERISLETIFMKLTKGLVQ